ncbi:hypothetical protein D3C72_2238370 [compost metagenome]
MFLLGGLRLLDEADAQARLTVLVEFLELLTGRVGHVFQQLFEDLGFGVVLSHFRLLFEP